MASCSLGRRPSQLHWLLAEHNVVPVTQGGGPRHRPVVDYDLGRKKGRAGQGIQAVGGGGPQRTTVRKKHASGLGRPWQVLRGAAPAAPWEAPGTRRLPPQTPARPPASLADTSSPKQPSCTGMQLEGL